jgi:hypothetical protein
MCWALQYVPAHYKGHHQGVFAAVIVTLSNGPFESVTVTTKLLLQINHHTMHGTYKNKIFFFL